jgi:endonuclease III related protein
MNISLASSATKGRGRAFPKTGNVSGDNSSEPSESILPAMVKALLVHYGEQNWWPAASRFEVMVGAILVQNTSWMNAERAVRQLRTAKALNVGAIRRMPTPRLEMLIQPSGYYRQKARTLKAVAEFVQREHCGLRRMFAMPTSLLRSQLLSIKGIGPETADAILLYAGSHEVFVADAYASRVLERHGISAQGYKEVNNAFGGAIKKIAAPFWHRKTPSHAPSRMSRRRLSITAKLYSESHAALVRVGVEFCRKQACCSKCPLKTWLPAHSS